MNLYIPEIGDHIKLTEDWTFSLHPEDRNSALAAFYKYYLIHSRNDGWVSEDDVPNFTQEANYNVDYPDYNHFTGYEESEKANREAEQNCPEYVKYWADHDAWYEQALSHKQDYLEVTLLAGTVLSIDRIYIRKGSSDFSSVTFYAKNLGEVSFKQRWSTKVTKKKSLRFWVKLNDCNTIQFEKTDKI